jgi:hypothetical protein
MRDTDLPDFTRALAGAALVCGRRLTDDLVAVYRRALDDVEVGALIRVLDRLTRTAESGTRLPTPAELRQRAGGRVQAPDTPLSAAALDRVRQAVFGTLARWEERGGDGTARPTFDAAWTAARRREDSGGTVAQRERLWQDWLAAGQPLTRARMHALLAAANRRRQAGTHPLAVGAVIGAVVRRLPTREPGCDDTED